MKFDLHNQTISIGFLNSLPYTWIRWDESIKSFKLIGGMDPQMFHLLSEHYNFTIQWVTPGYSLSSDIRRPLGTRADLIDMVYKKEIDLAVGGFMQTVQRKQFVDFLYPYTIDQIMFAYPPFVQDRGRIDLLWKPFQSTIWFILLFMFIGLWLFLKMPSFFSTIRTMFYCHHQHRIQKISQTKTDHNLLWICFSLLIRQQYYQLNSSQKSIKVLAIFWTFCSVILTSSYMGSFSSMLALPSEIPIDTIDELTKAILAGKITPMGIRNSSIVDVFSDSPLETFKVVWNHMTWMPNRASALDLLKSQNFLPKSERKLYAFILPRKQLRFFQLSLGQDFLYIPPENEDSTFYTTLVSTPTYKYFKYFKPFEKFISKMVPTGIWQRWETLDKIRFRSERLVADPPTETNINNGHKNRQQFTLKHLRSIFYFYLLFIIISIIAFLFEFCYHLSYCKIL